MESETRVRGVIQNAEYVDLALTEGREFIVLCDNEKDADSKRVSLFSVRRKLKSTDQRKIKISKQLIGEQWVVKIKREEQQVLEVVDGAFVPVQSKEIRNESD